MFMAPEQKANMLPRQDISLHQTVFSLVHLSKHSFMDAVVAHGGCEEEMYLACAVLRVFLSHLCLPFLLLSPLLPPSSLPSALPRQRVQLAFDKNYYIEPSFECRFDHIEVRDGPFGFSPIIDRFCGQKNPGLVTSTGRFMWIKFTSDEELEGLGFRIKYTFIAGTTDL